mmetsp:Transcript_80752/g.210658  ORF Transcript_80752/g.210658 Transcript_80752/m.210658 type:complete len:289 (-) Transcript_80752:47-913(-)
MLGKASVLQPHDGIVAPLTLHGVAAVRGLLELIGLALDLPAAVEDFNHIVAVMLTRRLCPMVRAGLRAVSLPRCVQDLLHIPHGGVAAERRVPRRVLRDPLGAKKRHRVVAHAATLRVLATHLVDLVRILSAGRCLRLPALLQDARELGGREAIGGGLAERGRGPTAQPGRGLFAELEEPHRTRARALRLVGARQRALGLAERVQERLEVPQAVLAGVAWKPVRVLLAADGLRPHHRGVAPAARGRVGACFRLAISLGIAAKTDGKAATQEEARQEEAAHPCANCEVV